MKRGLKGDDPRPTGTEMKSYNHCPDEKGTESLAADRFPERIPHVTTIAPMKRGLKANSPASPESPCSSYNHCPDEKGTESIVHCGIFRAGSLSYNHCPDEKGTESR